jgi:hypothetical protein
VRLVDLALLEPRDLARGQLGFEILLREPLQDAEPPQGVPERAVLPEPPRFGLEQRLWKQG